VAPWLGAQRPGDGGVDALGDLHYGRDEQSEWRPARKRAEARLQHAYQETMAAFEQEKMVGWRLYTGARVMDSAAPLGLSAHGVWRLSR
jgi:hypothetical protein